jgi:hypothetical protein
MPTLQEWRQALSTPRLVEVESSQALINEVQQKHDARDAALTEAQKAIPVRKGNLTEVAPFAPTRAMQIIPAALLHRLGVVTTPQVENLADLSSIWAYIRYIWAFDLPNPAVPFTPLRLSEAAQRIDFHQKAVLSDQIGIAMAALLFETELNAPLSSDVSVAMNDPAWPIDTLNRSSPDYLFFNIDQTNLYVVECKGTQSSRSAALEQLRRGCEQAASLIFTDGRARQVLRLSAISPSGNEVIAVACFALAFVRTDVAPPSHSFDDHRTFRLAAKAKLCACPGLMRGKRVGANWAGALSCLIFWHHFIFCH